MGFYSPCVEFFFAMYDFHRGKRENVSKQNSRLSLFGVSCCGAGVLTQSARPKCKACTGGEMGRSLETTDSSHARGGVKSAKKTKTNIGSLIWMTRHSGVFIIHKTDISKAKKTSTVARGSEVRTKIMAGKQRRLK